MPLHRPPPVGSEPPPGADLQNVSERKSGTFALQGKRVIRIENAIGAVLVNGKTQTGTLDWFIDKKARASTREKARALLDQIDVAIDRCPDTLRLHLMRPSGTDSLRVGSLLSLDVPSERPVRIEQARGEVRASDLRASLVVRKARDSLAVQRHRGACDLSGRGPVTVAVALPWGATCRAHTDGGAIRASVPGSTSADVLLWTGDGSIAYGDDLDLRVTERETGRLRGVMGGGAGRLSLKTDSGDVSLTATR